MRKGVFGTDAVGGYFGGRLVQSGEDVVFIARREHLKALRTQGLRVDSVKDDFVLQSVKASDAPAQVGMVDVVLVGVKAWQVPEAAQAMRPTARYYGRKTFRTLHVEWSSGAPGSGSGGNHPLTHLNLQ